MGWTSQLVFPLVAAAFLSACGGGGHDVPAPAPQPTPTPTPAPSVQVAGAIDHPAAFTVADLSARPAVTQTVTFNAGTTPQTHTYTGANLWSLLSDAGVQLDAKRKNDVFSKYVLATGSDGYKVIFTLGELSPDFGNKPSVVAYAETLSGTSAPLSTTDGPFRVTAPGDVKGGRYVSNLTRLDVRDSAATAAGTGGGIAPSFVVSGEVNTATTFDLGALQALPVTTQTVGTSTYTGVSLWTLLNGIGLKTAAVKNPTLSMYAVATGSDGYRAAVSLGEIDPGFGAKGALIAYDVNGAGGLGTNGVARLIVPGEVKQGRSVSNLIAIEVFTAPSP